MPRREFTRDVKAQIVKRAMNAAGLVACEGCGLVLGKRPYHIDHTRPDALEVDKSRRLTADDGKLLGAECCHEDKTRKDVAMIAKAKRREARHIGAIRPAGKIQGPGFAKPAPRRKATAPVEKLQGLPPPQLYGER